MLTRDQSRIERDRTRPRILELWRALRPLKSVVRFMQSGAHPDDESSAMLAMLRLHHGFGVSFACSTRGEGGQNAIGNESAQDLGALRTAEMEAACAVLGMRLYWLSEFPNDDIHDFGFSKSRSETFGKWGVDRTITRFVEVARTERPDILCPTFLDVPGQHGHHRAMTEAALQVVAAAADAGFPSNLAPWQVRKLYLPAWSGAGRSYDDDLPPPSATLTLEPCEGDPISGWSWERIGQQSRCFHRSQGMGQWTVPGQRRNWPLHLARSWVDEPDLTIASGLPDSVGDLANLPMSGPIAEHLRSANTQIDAAVDAFPKFRSVARHACQALDLIRNAIGNCPQDARQQILHRLEEKEVELGHVIRLALGVEARATVDELWLHPGSQCRVALEMDQGSACNASASVDTPRGCQMSNGRLVVGSDATATNTYRSQFDPAKPAAPAISIRMEHAGVRASCSVEFEETPLILPPCAAVAMPDQAVVNLEGKSRVAAFVVRERIPSDANVALALPPGWDATHSRFGLAVKVPGNAEVGLYNIPLSLDGRRAVLARRISHPHIRPTAGFRDTVQVLVLAARLPDAGVGYVGGGNDRIDQWLASMGCDVRRLSDEQLHNETVLAELDTVVIGICALGRRPNLSAMMPLLHDWIASGGTLVTLYHRPWDNWNPVATPPRRLVVGSPSIRWRVTDEQSRVAHLLPEHPILNWPNRISGSDWAGWHKERGLYFASEWDSDYRPLVEMADPGEPKLQGALLAADIGSGRHVHCSLVLHHQMERLVPGAYRLMANLIANRGNSP